MKTKIYLTGLALVVVFLVACKSQQQVSLCERVTQPREMPWLYSIVEEGVSPLGLQLVKIDKILYTIDESNTTNTGFEIQYEAKCCDMPNDYIYDCDGEVITEYGGFAGCSGECDIKILSRECIYERRWCGN